MQVPNRRETAGVVNWCDHRAFLDIAAGDEPCTHQSYEQSGEQTEHDKRMSRMNVSMSAKVASDDGGRVTTEQEMHFRRKVFEQPGGGYDIRVMKITDSGIRRNVIASRLLHTIVASAIAGVVGHSSAVGATSETAPAPWQFWVENDGGRIFFDPTSVTPGPDGRRSLRTVWTSDSPRSVEGTPDKTYKSNIDVLEFKCTTGEIEQTARDFYSEPFGRGEQVNHAVPTAAKPFFHGVVREGNPFAILMKAACTPSTSRDQNAVSDTKSATQAPQNESQLRHDPARSGGAAAGRIKATACVGCHGTKGVPINPAWPNLKGQDPSYLVAKMKVYRDGDRKDSFHFLGAWTDQDMENVATFYSGTAPKEDNSAAEADSGERAQSESRIPSSVQQDPSAFKHQGYLDVLPRPRATQAEMSANCTDSRWPSEDAIPGLKRTQLVNYIFKDYPTNLTGMMQEWGAKSFGRRVDCNDQLYKDRRFSHVPLTLDRQFIVIQWQRANGDPETGILTINDYEKFKNLWYPRLSQAYKDTYQAALDALPDEESKCRFMGIHETDIAVCVQGLRDQEHADSLEREFANELRSQPNVLGFKFNAEMPWLPTCESKLDGNYAPYLDRHETCINETAISLGPFGATQRVILLPEPETPEWMSGGIRFRTDTRNRLVRLVFSIRHEEAFLRAMDARFGRHSTEAVQLADKAFCSDFGGGAICSRIGGGTVSVHSWHKDDLTAYYDDSEQKAIITSDVYEKMEAKRQARSKEEEIQQQTTSGRRL